MRMDSYILCIGQFKQAVVNALDYDASAYEDVIEGTLVVTTLCNCNTEGQSRQLAEDDPWDFNNHCISTRREHIDWQALYNMTEYAEWDDEDLDDLNALLENGFLCLYQPNG